MSEMSRAKALKILDLPQFGPVGDVRAAWRRKVFEMHPDRGGGSDAEFALVNAAYAFLKNEPVRDRPEPAEAPEAEPARPKGCTPSGRNAPRRPEVQARVQTLSDDDVEACTTKLGVEAGHVPQIVRRRGRRVSYFIGTPLEEGNNVVAVPRGDDGLKRRRSAQLVAFSTGKSGEGEFVVPDATRESLFPGTKSVRLHFARTQ